MSMVDLPDSFESTNPTRDNLSREIGRDLCVLQSSTPPASMEVFGMEYISCAGYTIISTTCVSKTDKNSMIVLFPFQVFSLFQLSKRRLLK